MRKNKPAKFKSQSFAPGLNLVGGHYDNNGTSLAPPQPATMAVSNTQKIPKKKNKKNGGKWEFGSNFFMDIGKGVGCELSGVNLD